MSMLRIIHNLGGCGGTLLARCLGVLPGVATLSECNPGAVKLFPHFDPLYQDCHWLKLLSPSQLEHFSQLDLGQTTNFRDLIGTFHKRAELAKRHLVLRDFNYLDFVGVPFVAEPSGRLMIYEALPVELPVKAIALIRHPIDQWASLSKHVELTESLLPALFCDAYTRFLAELAAIKIYKYEDLVAQPEAVLKAMCDDLALPFDSSFLERFHTFDFVTGDFSRLRDTAISLPHTKNLPASILTAFSANPVYRKILQLTGYAEFPDHRSKLDDDTSMVCPPVSLSAATPPPQKQTNI